MKRVVVLSGSGISAESGLATFREMGGLWEKHDVTEVATPEAWTRQPQLVLEFYNQRRKQLLNCEPNNGHHILKALESYFEVHIITQNVDDLHERAGSSKILHLHGELKKVRSTIDPTLIYNLDGWELKWGDVCEKGSQLRPHIVWFGEEVPAIEKAVGIVETADVLIVVGTSLNVYPAAGLLGYVQPNVQVYVVDPAAPTVGFNNRVTYIKKGASEGLEELKQILLNR